MWYVLWYTFYSWISPYIASLTNHIFFAANSPFDTSLNDPIIVTQSSPFFEFWSLTYHLLYVHLLKDFTYCFSCCNVLKPIIFITQIFKSNLKCKKKQYTLLWLINLFSSPVCMKKESIYQGWHWLVLFYFFLASKLLFFFHKNSVV